VGKALATADGLAERRYEFSRLLPGGIERAQFTPAQHDELRPQPAVMRTDAKALAKPACDFMGHPHPLNGMRYYSALWQEFENFRSLSDHSRAELRRERMSMSTRSIAGEAHQPHPTGLCN
jgi:hypothetical protein